MKDEDVHHLLFIACLGLAGYNSYIAYLINNGFSPFISHLSLGYYTGYLLGDIFVIPLIICFITFLINSIFKKKYKLTSAFLVAMIIWQVIRFTSNIGLMK